MFAYAYYVSMSGLVPKENQEQKWAVDGRDTTDIVRNEVIMFNSIPNYQSIDVIENISFFSLTNLSMTALFSL